MNPDLHPLGRFLVLCGILIALCGLVLMVAQKIPWLGRFPGDIVIDRERVHVYFPLTSCVLASIVISVVVWLIQRFRS